MFLNSFFIFIVIPMVNSRDVTPVASEKSMVNSRDVTPVASEKPIDNSQLLIVNC